MINMLFYEKISAIKRLLNVTNSEIAKASGLDASCILFRGRWKSAATVNDVKVFWRGLHFGQRLHVVVNGHHRRLAQDHRFVAVTLTGAVATL